MVCQFDNNDSKWDLLKKILMSLQDVQSGAGASLQAIYDRLFQLISISSPASGNLTTGNDIVVAVAGTAVQGPNLPATRGVIVVARQDNTGLLYVGDSTVTNGSGTKKGIILGQLGMATSSFIPVDNANKIWINADNANDSVGVIAL